MRIVGALLLAVVLLGAAPAGAAAVVPPGFQQSVVWSGLVAPTAVEFAPDGRVFVAEKRGRVLEFDSLTDPTPTVFADLSTSVHDFWDRGMLGLAIDPDFANGRPYVYVLYAYNKDPSSATVPRWPDSCPTPPGATADGCVVSGRLSRLAAGGVETPLITDWCQQYPSHSTGDLVFGPGRALYVSAGDGASFNFADYGQDGSPVNPCGDPPGGVGGPMTPPTAEGGALRSQDVRSAGDPTSGDGTILRVDPDTGDALPDNPAAGSADPMARRIVSHGYRNPFRMTLRPGTGEIWVGDVGWNEWEEVNRIAAPTAGVGNGGWPCYEGAGRMSSYDNLNLSLCETLYAQGAAAHSAPYFAYRHADKVVLGEACGSGTSSIAGLAFYTGTQFPSRYRDGLFFADYSRSCIWFMPVGADGLPDPARRESFGSLINGIVGLTAGPDGALYYPDLNGAVRRIGHGPLNEGPTARATATPTSGAVPLTVQFDGSASTDPNGDALAYAWDLDGDGAHDDSTEAKPSRTYTTPGTITVSLRVRDPGGLESTATVTVTAGSPPNARIDAPAAGTTWAVDDVLSFSGGATDDQGAELPASRLSWKLVLQHCGAGGQDCHAHNVQSWDGVASGSFRAPDHEYPSHLELELTATDANGLRDVETRRLDPRTVNLTFETNPAGLQLSVGSFSGSAPFTRTVIVGSTQSLSAPSPQSLGGDSYAFQSWSDGGAQNHSITAPAAPATYRATFTRQAATPGLVGAWGFDEASGAQALDASGRGHNGAISGATRAAGRFGGGLSFDGVDDWVTVADAPALRLSGAMTLEAWVNPTALGASWRTAIMKERGAGLGYALYSNDAANHAAGYVNIGGTDIGAPSTAGAAPANAWTHLATTYDGTTLRVFANGTQVASRATTGSMTSSTGPLRFGGNAAWLDEFFQGRLDEIRVYDRALTAAQITADMNAPVNSGPAPPALSVTPSSLSFSATQGQASPAAKSLSVSNTGGGTLSFTASDDASWLSVSPGSGTAPASLSVAVDSSGLAPGTYNATVTVTASGAQGSPATIPVTLTVAPPPTLSVSPSSLSFSATQGQATPAAKSLSVSNTGGGTLSFTASDDASWLSVSPASGTAPQTVSVAVDSSSLAPGTYNATVTVTASGAQGSPATIPVTLTVDPAPATPVLEVSPTSLSFSATAGGPAPAAKTLDVTNSGGGTLDFTASDNATWLTVAPASGTAPRTLTVTASQAGLAAGTYNAVITVTAAGAGGSPDTVPVTFSVAAAPPPPGGGLVAAYGFGEASGTTVVDSSGAGNPGVISGATRTAAGRSGGALQFDGVNDWVTVADSASLDLTTGMTLEAWVFPTALGNVWRTVVMKERTGGLAYAIYAADDIGRPEAYSFTGTELGARGPSALPLNTWTHLAATYAGSTLTLFVNGSAVATRAVGSPLRASTRPFRIGGNAIWNEWFQGRIDEVRVYNRALTPAEIQGDMSRPVASGAVTALSTGRRASAGVVRRNLRRARRHASLARERAGTNLPLRTHARGR